MADEPEELPVFPHTPDEVAAYLTALLKDHGDEPEAIKAGVRFSILALRHIQKGLEQAH